MDYHIRRVCWKTPNESVGLMFSVYFTTSFISRIAFQGRIGQPLLILILHVHSTSMLFMVFDETLKQCCLIVQPSEVQNESIRRKSLCYAVGYTPWALVKKLHTHQYTFSKIIRLSTTLIWQMMLNHRSGSISLIECIWILRRSIYGQIIRWRKSSCDLFPILGTAILSTCMIERGLGFEHAVNVSSWAVHEWIIWCIWEQYLRHKQSTPHPQKCW